MTWDEFFFTLVDAVAAKSKDTSSKVGCVIVGTRNEVLSLGYNGLPRKANDSVVARLERPLKYKWFEHAERNAIYNAAANGITLLNSVLYVTFHPCTDCMRGIIQSGITKVAIKELGPERWREDAIIANEMARECSVEVWKR